MDASASHNVTTNFGNLFGFYVTLDSSPKPTSIQHKQSVTKYTRLPDFDVDNKVSWSQKNYTAEPRLRRIVTIEEPNDKTSRSLKSNVAVPPKNITSNIIRKIVSIEEDDERDLKPKISNTKKIYAKSVNRAVGTELEENKELSQKMTSRLSNTSKFSKDVKSSAKSNILGSKNDVSSSKLIYKSKYSKLDNNVNHSKNKQIKEDNVKSNQSANMTTKVTISRKLSSQNDGSKEIYLKNTIGDWKNNKLQSKKTMDSNKINKPLPQKRAPLTSWKYNNEKNKPLTVYVPIEKSKRKMEENVQVVSNSDDDKIKVSQITQVEKSDCKDVNVGTEPLDKVDQETEISDEFLTCNTYKTIVEYDRSNEIFDSLDIPNVSLTKDKTDLPKEEIVNFLSKSMPTLRVPALNMISLKETQNEQIKESLICNNNSYIISRATVTYTSKQKIDFQVVGNSENTYVNSRVRSSPHSYPISVVSVFKKELANREYDNCQQRKKKQHKNDTQYTLREQKDLTTLNCSLVFDSNKLKKPSDIISTIEVNKSLLQNGSVCEQFQRELNFIDSFFESLQCLESCSLSEKSITDKNVENWINGGHNFNLDCGSFLSKYENDICVEDNETMASNSLCMLNSLMRYEQRRAKNLMLVLKMREDALKDYTKSQILWLEDKKKQDNTDISTLKKKQRGALVKLQHECGEMQRMRKALLTLSEKRKTAFMKTKKNIEWKLENNLEIEKIINGKKKIKRVSSDRSIAPLKCFDWSSSGCDDSTTSRPMSHTPVILENVHPNVLSVEKCVQTGDSILETIVEDQPSSATDERFVVVDGGFLNIIFRDLSLPHIFSSEKRYEVNEQAINNIVSSSNLQNPNVDKNETIEKLMDQIKNHEAEGSSTPSTARSLVEEFDRYYRGLVEEEAKPAERTYDGGYEDSCVSKCLQETEKFEPYRSTGTDNSLDKSTETVPELNVSEVQSLSIDPQILGSKESGVSVAGPLPVPAGAAAVSDPPVPSVWTQDKSTTAFFGDNSFVSSHQLLPSVSSISSPVNSEAEELRRQQLAIEREIKALEQQQSQFLVVREIPDKPPPPYTPPAETRPCKPPKSFSIDETIREKIKKYVSDPNRKPEDTDAFEMFVKDFCMDSLMRQNLEESDKVWDTCSVVPPKPKPDKEELINKIAADLKEVLTCATPTVVSGVGARRSDHIDDILFEEWRRCEPEWTSLHADEVLVKNQLFETILQKILTETVDEYKRTVLNDK